MPYCKLLAIRANIAYPYGAMKKHTNLRNTKVKQLVAHIFQTTPDPISLQELFAYVRISLPKTAYSTVYRSVKQLQQYNLIRSVDWKERGSRYEWADRAHHHHITCQTCGKITDLEDGDLNYDEKHINQKTGYLTKHHSIELEGICAQCQQRLGSLP